MDEAVADIVHETQEYLCTLFIKAHGEDGDYEYALDAANSAAKHLQAILAELPLLPHWPAMPAYSLSPCARRNEICRQRRPADSLDELLGLVTSLKGAAGRAFNKGKSPVLQHFL